MQAFKNEGDKAFSFEIDMAIFLVKTENYSTSFKIEVQSLG